MRHAEQEKIQKKFILAIDAINQGNVSRLFGN